MRRGIRLPEEEVEIIKKTFREFFDHNEDHLWLFGSRTDLDKRGGDIDLYIQTREPSVDMAADKRSEFLLALWDRIGEQKIDIVLHLLWHPCDLPIYKVAQEQGILLV